MPHSSHYLRLLALLSVSVLPGCIAAPLIVGVTLQGGMLVTAANERYPATFFPVSGPLAAQPPPAPCTGYFNGLLSGNVVATLEDGEVFKGTWRPVPQNAMPAGSDSLEQDWDFVYGPGFYRAQILGTRLHVRAALNGTKGSTGLIEAYKAHDGAQPLGVARDSLGNVYKVTVGTPRSTLPTPDCQRILPPELPVP